MLHITLNSHLQDLAENGFNWSRLHSYFPFCDDWSEGEYQKMLEASLAAIKSDAAKSDLLAALDLQYAVLLEQLSIQEIRSREVGRELTHRIFGERVMAYLQINDNFRSELDFAETRSARSALLEIPQGQLLNKLFVPGPKIS